MGKKTWPTKKPNSRFMIMNEIISQEVQKLGLKTDDPKVSEKETELKQNMGTEEQFLDELKKMG